MGGNEICGKLYVLISEIILGILSVKFNPKEEQCTYRTTYWTKGWRVREENGEMHFFRKYCFAGGMLENNRTLLCGFWNDTQDTYKSQAWLPRHYIVNLDNWQSLWNSSFICNWGKWVFNNSLERVLSHTTWVLDQQVWLNLKQM